MIYLAHSVPESTHEAQQREREASLPVDAAERERFEIIELVRQRRFNAMLAALQGASDHASLWWDQYDCERRERWKLQDRAATPVYEPWRRTMG